MNYHLTNISKAQLGEVFSLLGDMGHLIRATVDIQGIIYDFSPSFLESFQGVNASFVREQKNYRISNLFDKNEHEMILSMLFQAVMWKKAKYKEFYLYQNDIWKEKNLAKYSVIAIPWTVLDKSQKQTQYEDDTSRSESTPKLSKPMLELIFIPQSIEGYSSGNSHNTGTLKLEDFSTTHAAQAHDLNNLLTGIGTVASLLRMQSNKYPELISNIELIDQTVQKATQLTSRILNCVKGVELNSQPLSTLSVQNSSLDCIVNTTQLFKSTLNEKIQLNVELPVASSSISVTDIELTQILMNLLTNAKDAIVNEGTITVTVDYQNQAGENYFILGVQDTGVGINQKVKNGMFKPFFSTKSQKTNSGLGLTIVQSLVEKASGSIKYESAEGKGTKFIVTLPVSGSLGLHNTSF
ncbi:MAG: sensor hybrid histidine kinase [Chlamydiales bacterium]|jgi:signal transduction histidine kinase|nr:sensor hybrid histidine kinase [Chlamydiales bacterium]